MLGDRFLKEEGVGFIARPHVSDPLLLPPGGAASVLLRYLPKALGHHTGRISFSVLAPGSAATLAGVAVEAVGSCTHAAPRAVRLPGGPDATPEAFVKLQ